MRSQGGSQVHAGHSIRLTIGPADVRLLFDARLRGQCACDFRFTDFGALVLGECDSRIMVGFQRGRHVFRQGETAAFLSDSRIRIEHERLHLHQWDLVASGSGPCGQCLADVILRVSDSGIGRIEVQGGYGGAVRPIQRVRHIVLFDEFPVAAGLRRLAKEYFIPFVNDDVRSTVNAGGTIVSCGESTGDIITELGENAFLILP